MSHLLTRLAIITLAAFFFCLALNAVLGGNPFNRVGFAVFVSLVPGIVSFFVFIVSKWAATWKKVITIYLALFVMTIIVQGLLRSV